MIAWRTGARAPSGSLERAKEPVGWPPVGVQ